MVLNRFKDEKGSDEGMDFMVSSMMNIRVSFVVRLFSTAYISSY
jgi:hypothetical protein